MLVWSMAHCSQPFIVIPRLKPGKQTAADIADPLLKDLGSLVVAIGADTPCELETLQAVSSLNTGVWDWADREGAGSAAVQACFRLFDRQDCLLICR